MSVELFAVFLGVTSAISWGAGDFSGGLAAKKTAVFSVVVISQMVGGALLLALALLLGEPVPPGSDFIWGAAAGLAGGLGLAALYRGLAVRPMGIVAPVAAVVTAVVPVSYAALQAGLPRVVQLAGFGLALLAVWLVTVPDGETAVTWRDLDLPLLAGLGFGIFLLLIGRVSTNAILWPLASARLASVTVLGVFAWRHSGTQWPARQSLPLIALTGLLDTGGNALYALAARYGRLDIAAVLSSLYPASTVLLARVVLGEQLHRRQWVGVVLALTAVFLIAL
jgi:drug/metabolite transporter (DMT)-like permease